MAPGFYFSDEVQIRRHDAAFRYLKSCPVDFGIGEQNRQMLSGGPQVQDTVGTRAQQKRCGPAR